MQMSVELRPMDAIDLPRIAEIFSAAFAADGGAIVVDTEELADEMTVPFCDPDRDVRVAVEQGVIIGAAYTYFLPAAEREVRCYLQGKVHPSHRGRGAGRALLDWGLAHGEDLLRDAATGLPRILRVSVPTGNEAMGPMLVRRGLAPVRWFSELLRDLDDTPHVEHPRGIEIVPWDEDRSGEALAVSNAAFADHWGSAPMHPDGWHQRTTGYGAHPATSFMALAGGRVVAFLTSHRYPVDDEVTGMEIGWVNHLGTLATHRKRGIASALVATALAAYRTHGWTHAAIEVDDDNPTGARGLYGALGFAPWRGSVTWEKPVSTQVSAPATDAEGEKGP